VRLASYCIRDTEFLSREFDSLVGGSEAYCIECILGPFRTVVLRLSGLHERMAAASREIIMTRDIQPTFSSYLTGP